MEISEEFVEKKYVYVQNLVDEGTCSTLTEALKNEVDVNGSFDDQCPKSKFVKNSETFDKLLVELLPDIEQITGLKLLPTYSYARWYVPGEELKVHRDREACEISVTLTLGFDGSSWPIFMGNPSEQETPLRYEDEHGNVYYCNDAIPISMNVGDAVVYKGCEMLHWREKYKEGNWQAQVFLHYVDANGPNKDWVNDKRISGKEKNIGCIEDKDLTCWIYNDVLTESDCDGIVKAFTSFQTEDAGIGVISDNPSVDKSVRNVKNLILPTHMGIGAILTAVGINANFQRWQFNIEKANQCEFLHYPAGVGKYKAHIDTFLSKTEYNMKECRKLTVLAFLNDDFKGGKFFLQVGKDKFYPPQNKGTVIVFPSFLLHGVEDVEEGERFSAVCWLVGPWFK